MSQDKKNLKAYSIFFYVFAALDLLEAIAWIYIGFSGNTLGLDELASVDTTALKISAFVVAVFALVEMGLECYLGNRGMAEIKGTYSGTAHLKLAAVLGVLNIVGCAISLYGLIKGYSNVFELICEVLAVVILFSYRNYCKKVLESK